MNKHEMFEQFARSAHEKGVFTGTWLYAENGEVVSKGAVGFRDSGDTLPMREDSIFNLASVSKQFTASAIMLLMRKGLLSLDDEIMKFFPQIPYKGVTVRHLLTHTGGLPDYMDWVIETAKAENRIPGNEVIVRFLTECGEEPEFAPGERYEYSNTGYCLLAQIVEKVSGVPFEDFMKQNVFEPACLTSTFVGHPYKDGITIENGVCGMFRGEGGFISAEDTGWKDYFTLLDGGAGCGFVYSNILDLFKWDKALRENLVLSAEEQKLMSAPAMLNNGEPVDNDEGGSYGFGWGIENDENLGLILSHSGGWAGFNTRFERFIDANRVFVLLNCRETDDVRGLDSFETGMREIARDKEPKPVTCIEDLAGEDTDRSKWTSFCGRYERPEDGGFAIDEVCLKEGDLFAKAFDDDGDEFEFKLYPIGESKFGRKGGMIELTFGDGCLTYINKTCKKL
ncbi:MAG: beta-lactamase family protein [Clostridia bacterium]|nr:beta-lactamase family protein [Clostridia bacterium]